MSCTRRELQKGEAPAPCKLEKTREPECASRKHTDAFAARFRPHTGRAHRPSLAAASVFFGAIGKDDSDVL